MIVENTTNLLFNSDKEREERRREEKRREEKRRKEKRWERKSEEERRTYKLIFVIVKVDLLPLIKSLFVKRRTSIADMVLPYVAVRVSIPVVCVSIPMGFACPLLLIKQPITV
uniref:Uncharacterized protein n=1 Tax=Glossina brevipalpis TaxID=37001 RepID=A0A1A9WBQ6_9MUSC